MSHVGVIREWNDDEGWGVIDSSQTPGGCWAHFSNLYAATFWTPVADERVSFDFEAGEQDGYDFRATRVWPQGSAPVERTVDESGSGFGSGIHFEFD